MKFITAEHFTIEIEDLKIVGTYKKLTKKHEADIRKKFKKEMDLTDEVVAISKKLRRLEVENKIAGEDNNKKLLEFTDKLEDIEAELKKANFEEAVSKHRFDLSVNGENLEELVKLAVDFGYPMVLRIIREAIEEDKKEAKKN